MHEEEVLGKAYDARLMRRLKRSTDNIPFTPKFHAALLAAALAQDHEVHLFHRVPSLTVDKLAANSGTNLNGVELSYVADEKPSILSRRNPLSHYRESRKALARLSDSYDVFVAIVHNIPPFCHAARGALIVLFPAATAPYVKPLGGLAASAALKHPARYAYKSWEWAKRMEGYQVKTVISEFSRHWTQKLWGVDCQIVYPPVDTGFSPREKQKIILSVGRFAMEGEGQTFTPEAMVDFLAQLVAGKPERRSVAAHAESDLRGLREKPERRRALQLCVALAVSAFALLGAAGGALVLQPARSFLQIVARVFDVFSSTASNATEGVAVIGRMIGRAAMTSPYGFGALIALVFIVAISLLPRLIASYHRTQIIE